ncbi:MAG: PD-(D/E)XK nuclease family protein [Bacteroides sp.]|nr:PD-(D/E)XK nuclease family protein [Bacteroides sp.]
MKPTIETLNDFLNSRALQRIICQRNNLSFLDILGIKKPENAYSSVLGWICSNKDFLDLPISSPLLLIRLIASKAINHEAFELLCPFAYSPSHIEEVEFEREKALGNDRIDLCITIRFSAGATFRIWIENKISAPLGKEQLTKYHDYISSRLKHENTTDLFVYLTVDKKRLPDHPAYIHITYQDIYNHVLVPLLAMSEEFGKCRSALYLKEYMSSLTSYDDIYQPIVKDKEFLADLKEIYEKYLDLYVCAISDSQISETNGECSSLNFRKNSSDCILKTVVNQYSGIFIAAIREFGTEEEKENFTLLSQNYEIRIGNHVEFASGFTKLARKVFRLLLRHDHTPAELLKKLKVLEYPIAGFDNHIADDRQSKGADSRYSRKSIGRPGIYVSNQWNIKKAELFINQVRRYFPSISINRIHSKY